LTPEEFIRWVEQIYDTQNNEFDCTQTQAHLAAYVEAQVEGYPMPKNLVGLQAHLHQCSDCHEVYEALYDVVEAEVMGGLEPEWLPETAELTPFAAD
jgi:predicted anti-sigma-YlaC factor YlaD